jgi:RNA polymerase-binding transcription factor DksA
VPRKKFDAIWFFPASNLQVTLMQEPFTPESALSRLDLERAMSALIADALERLANGTYGRCARCSTKIAPQRLRALPWVRMCRQCADNSGP